VFTSGVRFGDWILCDNTTIILDLDLQLVVRHNTFAKLKDLTETIRSQPMFGVLSDVSLQQDRMAAAEHTAAIDEFLSEMSNFRHVYVSGDEIAIR
jgi:hypothetical protein